jgi:hypothetical protein
MKGYKFAKVQKALLVASQMIEDLCATDQEYGTQNMQAWSEVLEQAVAEIETNSRWYVGTLKTPTQKRRVK